MNKVIDRFGKVVAYCVRAYPGRAFFLLKSAYQLSGLQLRHLPNPQLLPHQKYVSVVCNEAIRRPLCRPETSAIVNVFLPCEILHAMDIVPQFTEGLACYLNGAGSEQAFIECAEGSGVPQSYCSYHKALLGAAFSGVLPRPRFVANTTLACDANINTFRELARFYNVPHFTVDVPGVLNGESVAYVATQMHELAHFIEDAMGKKLDGKKLRSSIATENRSIRLYHEYFRELSSKYLPNELTSEMYKIFLTHVLMGTPHAEHYFKLLLEDVRRAKPANGQKRILWIHTIPFWQDSMKAIFNFSRDYQLLCCDLNFDFVSELDESDPYEAMARKVLLNTLRGSEDHRASRVLEAAQRLHADGAVYFCHWGCKQTLGGAQYTKELLERHGIPVLILDGDGCDHLNINDGQMHTRMQAFLEMLGGTR